MRWRYVGGSINAISLISLACPPRIQKALLFVKTCLIPLSIQLQSYKVEIKSLSSSVYRAGRMK